LLIIQKDYLDDDGKRFSPIVTDFSRISQPIIRYRLDDIITERRERCPCGSPFTAIEQIEGRCDDIFYIPAKTTGRLIPVFPDFIRRPIVTADESIKEYVAIQKAESHIQIDLRGDQSGTKQRVKTKLDKLWDILGTVSPKVEFIEIPHQIAGRKLRRVERQFPVMK
jgi:putative adenylate-forming enzyme